MLQHRLRIYSTFILATSLFFWIWAMLNTIHLRRNNSSNANTDGVMMMDLGLISFFGTGVSASCLLRKSSRSVFSAAAAVLHKYCSCCRRTTTNTGVISSDMVEHNNNKTTIPHHLHTPPGKCLRTFTLLTQLTVSWPTTCAWFTICLYSRRACIYILCLILHYLCTPLATCIVCWLGHCDCI